MDRGHTINVLDHGYLKLIDHMGGDEDVISAARISTGRGFVSWDPYARCRACGRVWLTSPEAQTREDWGCLNDEETRGIKCVVCPYHEERSDKFEQFPRGDLGLLERLWSGGHATPFEMVQLVVEVQAPIMVFREWHRHRTQGFSEFSARYAQMPNLHYVPDPSRIQKQSATNKQGSAEAMSEDLAARAIATLRSEQDMVYDGYDELCELGVAKEVARINTPVSRYSKMRATANLRNWLGFLKLRLDKSAQWEIREYAKALSDIVSALWPRTYALFEEHTLHSLTLSRTQRKEYEAYLATKK